MGSGRGKRFRLEILEKGNQDTRIPQEGPEKEAMSKLMLSCGMTSVPQLKYGCTEEPELLIKIYEEGRLAGYAGIIKRHHILNSLFLAVDEKAQGKGIGTRLVKEVLKRKKGLLFLTVWLPNAPARRVYEKTGFITIIPWRKIMGMRTMLMVHF